jgi:hypothetical protein
MGTGMAVWVKFFYPYAGTDILASNCLASTNMG